jgi:hypothetical protein
MLQRSGLVVPFGEFADDLTDIDAGMEPLGARGALVGLHDVAADDDDRHAVAPGVVHRHRRVLQADDAVAAHRHRLAFDFGVALRHMHADILVHASDDFRLVVAVIDDRFVQAAIARRAIDREILDAQRVEYVGHEVAAARGLVHRVSRRRHGLGGDLARTRQCRLQALRRGDRHGVAGDRRRDRRGCAHEAGAFEEIASARTGRIATFRHGVLRDAGL